MQDNYKSKLGIVNATACYHEVESIGNKNIRTLFASTGVKGDNLPKSYYIDSLIFPNSINTAPLDAIDAWVKDGQREEAKILSLDKCKKFFDDIESQGINLNEIYNDLLNDGLKAFVESFDRMLKDLNQR